MSKIYLEGLFRENAVALSKNICPISLMYQRMDLAACLANPPPFHPPGNLPFLRAAPKKHPIHIQDNVLDSHTPRVFPHTQAESTKQEKIK